MQNTRTNNTCETRFELKALVTTLLHLPTLQIDSSLTTHYPTSSKIETEPGCHHHLHIPQLAANAGHRGF